MNTTHPNRQHHYVLRFQPLNADGCGLCFPCNAAGEVPLAMLGERIRNNYFLARVGIGRAFRRPRVEPLPQEAVAQAPCSAAAQPRDAYLSMRPRPTAMA